MPITVTHTKVSAIPDSGDDSLIEPSDWNATHTLNGLGTMAEQNANSVAITGGTISGVTIPASNVTGTLGVPNGGTGATTLTGYVKGTGTTAMTASATIPNTDITGLGTASTKDAGAALGVATLDAGGKVPVSELPAAVLGALSYQGTWDASTNTPTLTSSTGTKGYYYVVAVAGTTNLDGITDWQIGDWAVYNGTVWQKVDNTDAGGDVVGPASATDNAIARFDTTTGKLIQNSLVIIGDTGSVTGVNALTAESLTVNNNATLGSSNTDTLDVNARITTDLEPNANNSKDIGTSGRNWRDAFFGRTVHTVNLELTGTTSFDGSQGTSGQVLTSQGTGVTPTWTTPTTGTVTSVDLTASTGISVSGGPITSSGSITVTNTAPDQVVSLTGAGTTSISGTYPNFTVTSNDQFTGTVTAVTGTAPVVSSGGNTPAISMAQATGSVDGYLSATDWTTFNSKQAAGTYVTAVSVASSNGFTGTSSGGATPALTLATSITGMLKGNGTAISAGTAGSDFVAPATATSFTAQQYFGNVALTDAATISWAASTAQVATFTFVSSNRTMGAPTGLVSGAYYGLAVLQNGGSNTLTWNSVFKWAGGTAPTLSTAAGAKDYFVFRTDGTNMYEQGRSLGVA